MKTSLANLLNRLKPRFVLYKGWVIDIPDILLISLIIAVFLPILPSQKVEHGFKVLGFKGTVENQYSLLVDEIDSSGELKVLNKLLEMPVVDLDATEKMYKAKGFSEQAAVCLSSTLLASDILFYQLSVQGEINALAPSTVPAIWLLRLPAVGVLSLLAELEDLSEIKDTYLVRCKNSGLAPVYAKE